MANTPTVYVFCNNNCKYEGLTKEQILTAITQAINEGTIGDIDTGFVTTIKTINGSPLKFFVGTQDEYEALTDEQREGLYAIITNDPTAENLANALVALERELDSYKEAIDRDINQYKTDGAKALEDCREEIEHTIYEHVNIINENLSGKAAVSSIDFLRGCIILANSTNTPSVGDTVLCLYLPRKINGGYYQYAFKDEEKANTIQTNQNPNGTVTELVGPWFCCGAFPDGDNGGYMGIYQLV